MDVESRIASAVGAMPGVLSVYLFGSVAEGREHQDSDIDIGVLLDRTTHATAASRFELRLLIASRVSEALRRDADVVILNEAPPQLARAIVTRGHRIYCSDQDADHAFVRDAQLLAADIDPWLRRMRAIKLDVMQRR